MQIGNETFRWHYIKCLDDHLIDLSDHHSNCHYLRAWAYTELHSSQAQSVTLCLSTYGLAELWLNGKHIHRQEEYHHVGLYTRPCSINLQKGRNQILVVAAGPCPYGMALQIVGLDTKDGEILCRLALIRNDASNWNRSSMLPTWLDMSMAKMIQ